MVGCTLIHFKQKIMRSLFFYIAILVTSFSFIGCEKTEEVNNTETEIGHSRVTFFPTFTMKGDPYMSIVKGGTYTEPGVTAKEGAADIPVVITGQVDASKPGVYDIVYTATNKDKFSSSVTRTVAVLPSAEQAGVDISGTYFYVATPTYTTSITKLSSGFYLAGNVWSTGSVIPSYIITVDGKDLVLPLNSISAYGNVQGTGTLDDQGNLTYKVDLLDYGITGSTRKWKKQ